MNRNPIANSRFIRFPLRLVVVPTHPSRSKWAVFSKNHAEILASPTGGLILRELGSTNGTFVNGEQVSGEIEIQENDLIHFAAIVFRVGVRQAIDNQTQHHTDSRRRLRSSVGHDSIRTLNQ